MDPGGKNEHGREEENGQEITGLNKAEEKQGMVGCCEEERVYNK